jgi:alkaline phosphatase D
MKTIWLPGVVLLLAMPAMGESKNSDKLLSRIAFGSCAKQNQPQPIWDAVVQSRPDLFLFIGDNIYGDSRDMSVLKSKWDQLAAQPGYQKLKQTCRVLATWDDHDFGENDAGVEYPKKRETQKLFLDFFDEPLDSPRRKQEGVYDALTFGPEGRRVQILLLDTRYFRDPLIKKKQIFEPGSGYNGEYVPNRDPATTLLGDKQWAWLEEQLKQPAELRIIASSIQVIPNEHGWEKWGNFPHERDRLFQLLQKTKARGVVFISGDRHHAEISRLDRKDDYPLFDVTSSSLNQPGDWHNELNPHRVGVIYNPANFGMILIDWNQADPVIRLQVRSETGKTVLQAKTTLRQIHFPTHQP